MALLAPVQRPVVQVRRPVRGLRPGPRQCERCAAGVASRIRAHRGSVAVARRHGTLRPRRPPQRGQVIAVQRPHRRRRARRAVRLRHQGPERRRRQGARRPARPAGGDVQESKNVVPAAVQFVDIGGLVEGASKGEGLGNQFLGHIREVDAIVFVLRAFDDDDVPGPDRPARAPARRRDRAGPGRPRDGREAARPSAARRPSWTSRSADEVAALEAAYDALADGHARSTAAGLDADAARAAARRTSCSPTSRCWPSSTSARTSSTRIPERRGAGARPS